MQIRKASFTKGGVTRSTKKYYARFYDHREVRRHLPLFADKKNSEEAGRAIERLIGFRASGADLPSELHRFIENTLPAIRTKLAEWDIVDPTRVAAVKLLAEHQKQWKSHLLSLGNGAEYVELKVGRVTRLFQACGFVAWADIRATVVASTLAEWRNSSAKPISAQTSNFYLQAAKQFCTWMVRMAKCASVSPLAELAAVNVKTDRRHDRRAYTLAEFRELLRYLQDADPSWGVSAQERSLIYQFAVETGLRRGAIAAIRVRSFGKHGTTSAVLVPAGASNKYKHDRWVLLRQSLWTLLSAHMAGKQSDELVFRMPSKGHSAKMVRKDVDAARARWISQADTDEERQRREQSNFLRYQDDAGLFLDFHAFRHTRGVWLFEHHNAKPREVQELLGVGSLALVDRYTKSMKVTDAAVIERGPDLVIAPASDRHMTGTIESTENAVANGSKSLSPSLSHGAGFGRHFADRNGQSLASTDDEADEPDAAKTLEKPAFLTTKGRSDRIDCLPGGVAERLIAPVLKTGIPERVSGVRIPPPPLRTKSIS